MKRSTDLCFRALRVALALVVAVPAAWANPSGGVVTSGSATIGSSGSTLTVNQTTNRAIINWSDFSIAPGETTRFVQPSATSAALNRVTSANPSSILGTLSANGQIYLINPNGITVGAGGVINTQSFIASTLGLTDSQFLAGGDMTFSGPSQAGVVNAGQITALGGDVLLVGRTVRNTGTLTSQSGTTGLAAGSQVFFATGGNQRVFVQAGSGSGGTGVDQQGQIQAASAELAAAGGNVYALAINNAGPLTVHRVRMTGDRIALAGDTVTNGDQVYTGAVTAQNSIALTSNSGALTFNGAVNTGFNLTTNSAQHTTFRGAVSVGSSLTSNITSSAGSIDLWSPSIVSGGDQTYTGPIFVGLSPAINSLFGNLTFNGNINGIHSTPNQGFEANMRTSSAWNTNFNGPATLGTLTSNITGPGAVNFYTGAVTTFYNQTYNGPVNAQVDTVLRASDGNLIFNGPVNAAFSLTTHSTGDTYFNGPVFVGNSLTSNASFGAINLQGGSIISGGDQTYSRPVKLGADNSLSSLYGNLNFDGTVDGAYALTTKSAWNTNFNQAVGAATPLASLTSNIITPGQADVIGGPGHININGGSLITSGDQTYNGPVYAQPDTVLSSNSGNLNFNGPVNAGNSLTTNSAEKTTFDGAVFAGNSLTSNITSSGGEIKLNGGSVISGGDQAYNGPIFLGRSLTLNSLFGNLNFNGDINGVFSGPNSQIENAMTTYSAWNTTFNGAVSLGHLSSNITSSDGAINMNAGQIHTFYNQTYNGTLRLGRDSRLISREAVLSLNGTVDGGYNLEVLSGLPGTVSFNGRVGSITPLVSLIAGGGTRTNLNGGSITTVNDLRLHGATWLGSDNTLTSTAGNVSFGSRVDGGYGLTTNSHLNTSFEGHVGSNIPLESLTANITGPGGIFLNGNTVTTTGPQIYNGPVNP